MRVIAGSARSLLLKAPEGLDTRPTTDRIKETLFNMLMPYIPDSVFVDCFSGSGAIGIEAISRGARKAYLIENSTKAYDCINDNVNHCKFTDKAVMLKQDVFSALRGSITEEVDVIFMDPPYNQSYERRALEILADASYITDDTLIVVEASLDTDFDYVDELGFEIIKNKLYKTNKHLFIKRKA